MSQRYIAIFLQKNTPQHGLLNSYRDKFTAQIVSLEYSLFQSRMLDYGQ